MISTTTRITKPLLAMTLLAAATGGTAMLWSELNPAPLETPPGSGGGAVATLETDPVNEASATLEGHRPQARHEHGDQRLTELNNQMAPLKNEVAQFKRAQNQKLTQLQDIASLCSSSGNRRRAALRRGGRAPRGAG